MFDDAALVLEEIAPEDKNREGVLGARVVLYMAGRRIQVAVITQSLDRVHLYSTCGLIVPTGACSAWPSLKIVIKPTPQRPHHILSWRGMNRRNI